MAKRILIVEDELDLLELAILRLEKAGYEVVTAGDGEEALDKIKKDPPDLILLDLLLPKLRGEAVCKQLKADDKLKHIPVILFTATIYDLSAKTKETGADDSILKPFEPEELFAKIGKFIRLRAENPGY